VESCEVLKRICGYLNTQKLMLTAFLMNTSGIGNSVG